MPTVLIVEDDVMILENISEIVELYGLTAIEAQNGKTGLQLVEQLYPDVIVCDIVMPKVNGYEFIRRLKKDERFSHIPVIFISCSSETKDRWYALSLGAKSYLNKPFSIEELIGAIDEQLERRSAGYEKNLKA